MTVEQAKADKRKNPERWCPCSGCLLARGSSGYCIYHAPEKRLDDGRVDDFRDNYFTRDQ